MSAQTDRSGLTDEERDDLDRYPGYSANCTWWETLTEADIRSTTAPLTPPFPVPFQTAPTSGGQA